MTTQQLAERITRALTGQDAPTRTAGAKARGHAYLRVWTAPTDARTLRRHAARALLERLETR